MEQRLKKLEEKLKLTVPGTIISRVLLDQKLWKKEKIDIILGNDSWLMWRVGVGQLHQPKIFAYGRTIEEAINNLELKCKNY
jgi:hypothetical protein